MISPEPRLGRLGNPRTRHGWASAWALIRADIAFRCAYEFKPADWRTGLRMLRHPGVACVVRYRLQCFFYSNGLRPLGWLMKYLNLVFYGVRIDERARIGGGLYIGHATSILIAENVTIGERFTLFHQNTIGVSPWNGPRRATGQVSIGNDVSFGGGACAYGDIVIGDGSSVGVNAVVDRSFPAKASLFGVPAKMVGELLSSKASAV